MINSIFKLLSTVILGGTGIIIGLIILLAVLPVLFVGCALVWALGIPLTITGRDKKKVGELRWFTFTPTKE